MIITTTGRHTISINIIIISNHSNSNIADRPPTSETISPCITLHRRCTNQVTHADDAVTEHRNQDHGARQGKRLGVAADQGLRGLIQDRPAPDGRANLSEAAKESQLET